MKNNTLFLFVKISYIGKCQISIMATDTYGLTNYLPVNITIKPWASKDWISWRGNLQSDWLEWVVGYRLDLRTGAWLEVFQYQSFILDSYFKVIGFITFTLILVPIWLSKLYGKITLYPISYIQIIIAILFSDASNTKNIQNYFEWMQIYKLDFGFFNNILLIQDTLIWSKTESDNFKEIQFYWSGFVVKYVYFLLFVAILLLLKLTINKISIKWNQNILINSLNSKLYSSLSRQFIWWFLQNTFTIFPLWCIFYDLANLYKYFANAFISFMAMIILVIIVVSTKFEWISYIFIIPNQTKQSSIYAYLHIIRNITIILLFWIQSSTEKQISTICFWWAQLSITAYIMILLQQDPGKDLITMAIYNLSILVYIPLYMLPISPQFQISVDTTFCLLLSLSVFLGAVVILFPTNQVVKLWFTQKKIGVPN